ncbi:FAD-dependent monooxygenase [Arthrobacter dokdonensis]|uniref:FAD-dependent monooxygenase n=1 Tax=Arthrobacter dokdonellae TaxID=2211210 RepID=UPI000DE5B590|nr:FAD-dependent monooxygenase [Arthrobacter dokdonellae]
MAAERPQAGVPVVIAGAGPVGLMLACELAAAGIATTVLERALEPSAMPKGNGLVGEIAGVLSRRGLLRGQKGLHAFPAPRYSFGALPLRLNPLRPNALRILPMPQRRLEGLLEARARATGVDIRRGHAATAFKDDGGRVLVEVASAAGRYTLDAGFLAGCDGAHSFVRHHLGIDFPGTTGSQLVRIGHVTIPAGAIHRTRNAIELPGGARLALFQANHTAAGSLTVAPVSVLDRGAPKELYIVATQEPLGTQEPAAQISLEEMEASIRRVLGARLPVSGGQWLRSTVANSRLAARYRIGRVFLAGDAAHVFSAGGSSLNTGMLDAVDLASRLAAVLDGSEPLETLEDYHTVRHAAGELALRQTRAQSALSAPGPEAEALRQVLGAAFRSRNPHRYLATLLIGKPARERRA